MALVVVPSAKPSSEQALSGLHIYGEQEIAGRFASAIR
jgi:hypothetical protein